MPPKKDKKKGKKGSSPEDAADTAIDSSNIPLVRAALKNGTPPRSVDPALQNYYPMPIDCASLLPEWNIDAVRGSGLWELPEPENEGDLKVFTGDTFELPSQLTKGAQETKWKRASDFMPTMKYEAPVEEEEDPKKKKDDKKGKKDDKKGKKGEAVGKVWEVSSPFVRRSFAARSSFVRRSPLPPIYLTPHSHPYTTTGNHHRRSLNRQGSPPPPRPHPRRPHCPPRKAHLRSPPSSHQNGGATAAGGGGRQGQGRVRRCQPPHQGGR